MNRSLRMCCLAVALVVPNSRLNAATFFNFTSAPGAWIGQGQTLSFTDVSVSVTYNLGAYSDSVNFSADGYAFTLVSTNLTIPTVGYYSNATRWPFQGSGPGMAFTAPGRGDNTLTGYFNVLQAVYDTNGQVVSFAVDFLQYDEGGLSAWNMGSIRYDSTIPEPSSILLTAFGLSIVYFGARRKRRGTAGSSHSA
jgi:hypothetical protein